MFLLWYWFSWIARYDRYSFYSCRVVTCFSLPLYRKSSFGFRIQYIILTFCRCGMIIFIYFNILLRFLINLFTIVFIGGKGSEDDISSDNENEDDDKTPTNERVSGDDLVTPNETINDITDLKHNLEQVKRVARGEEIDKKDLDNIKEEYGAYFDEDSGNATEKESLNEIIEYIESELSLL